jgi:hypothetical protein
LLFLNLKSKQNLKIQQGVSDPDRFLRMDLFGNPTSRRKRKRIAWVEVPSIRCQIGARESHDPSGSELDVMSG